MPANSLVSQVLNDATTEAARRLLDPAECALIVIDIQEKLLPPIFER